MVHFILSLFQDDDPLAYVDDEKDKTVQFKDIETREGIERLDKFSQVAEDSERFGISDLASFLMINHTLEAVGKKEEFLSMSGLFSIYLHSFKK